MKVYTTGQVAELCHVAPRTVARWFDSNKLFGYRIPGSQDRRIPQEYLIRFLREHSMPIPSSLVEASEGSMTQAFIDAARKFLQPHPVRAGHIPRWFGRKNFERLAHLTEMDHYGSVRVDDIVYFVFEPYDLTRKGIDSIDDLCNEKGFIWRVDPNSWHYPCQTTRIVISNHDWKHPV